VTIRFVLALGLMALACGGESDKPLTFPQQTGGTGGQAPSEAGASSSTGGSETQQGGATATAGSGAAQAGSSTGTAGAGGTAEPTAGAGGTGAAGEHAGGSSGNSGSSPGGSGGSATEDPLDPKPAEGCPGYVDIAVPSGTCALIKGAFTTQTATCSLANPSEKACVTVTAGDAPGTARVSSTAFTVERFDLGSQGCPMTCD
jgi:hypothetical protein